MRDLTAWLARPLPRLFPRQRRCRRPGPVLGRLGRDERGAIGVLVGVLIGGGVLVGMGALVIDVGQLYTERAELQNGADAAALGVAKSCGLGSCAPGDAIQYADANASKLTGGVAGVNLVCGTDGLGACPGSSGTMTDCPPAPPGAVSWVDVHTGTQTASGSTLLPPAFARTLLGNGDYQGSTVYACAQAEWGGPAGAITAGFTISACEWDQATNLGTTFAPPPPYPPHPFPPPLTDQVLQLHGTGGSTGGCPTEPAGADGPGNFGWTNDPGGNCTVAISNSTYGGNVGTDVSQACQALLSSAQSNKSVIFVPIYVSITGPGDNSVYSLKGFAAFVVTGYHLPGFFASDWLDKNNNCTGQQFCINGFFTQAIIPAADVIGGVGGADLGAETLRLTG